MRTSHIYLFGVAIATVALVASAPSAASPNVIPVIVQAGTEASPDMSAEQRAEFSSWPSEQQAQYELWPAETQGYYWTLPRPRQILFWQLSDEDKIALTAMTGPERDSAWSQIEQRAVKPPTDG